jgi:hypothetical protein
MAIKDQLNLAEPGSGGFFNSDAYATIYEQALRNEEAKQATFNEYVALLEALNQQEQALLSEKGFESLRRELEPTLTQKFNQMVQNQPAYQEYTTAIAGEESNIARLQSARQRAIETGQPQSIKFREPGDTSTFNLLVEPPGREFSLDQKTAYERQGISVVNSNWIDNYRAGRAPIIEYYKQAGPITALREIASDMGRQDLSAQTGNKSLADQIDFYQKTLFDDFASQNLNREIESRSGAIESQRQQLGNQYGPVLSSFAPKYESIYNQIIPLMDRYRAEEKAAQRGVPVEDIIRESDEWDAARAAEKQARDRLTASPEYQNLVSQGKYDEIYNRYGIIYDPKIQQLQDFASKSPVDPSIFVPIQADTTPILQPVVPPPQFATQTQGQAQPTQGVQAIQAAQTTQAAPQISKEIADRLAKELIVAGNIGNLTEGNQAVSNPVDTLSRYIQANGLDKTVEDLRAQNVDFSKYYVPKTAPDVAKDLANKISSALGFPPADNPAVGSYQLTLQNSGIEAGLKEIADINKKSYTQLLEDLQKQVPGEVGPIDYYNTRNTDALKGFYDTAGQTFNQNLQDILAGKNVRPTVAPQNVPAEEAVTQAFLFYGNQPTGPTYEYWRDYFNKFGNDVGLSQLSAQMAGQRPGQGTPTVAEPREISRGDIYNVPADFYGEETSPFAGGYRPSTAYPTFQQQIGIPTGAPTGAFTNVPTGVPSGQTMFPPSASRPFITEAERPTLDTDVEYIQSTTPGAGPMPYMTSQQVGGSPVAPASYADLFGYTPYTEYMGRSEYTTPMTSNLYDAGYEANIPPEATMRKGGSVADARGLSALGRGGDTMLVHMAPEEVAGLRAIAMREGTDLTINPDTGLPEAKKLKRFFKQVLLPAAAAYFGAPYLGGIGNASMLYGAATAIKTGSFEKGLSAGLAAYGGASLGQAAFGASPGVFGAPASGAASVTAAPTGPSVDAAIGGVDAGRVSGGYGDFTGQMTAQQAAVQAATSTPSSPTVPSTAAAGPTAPAKPPSFGERFTEASGMSPSTALIGTTMLAGLSEGDKERELYEAERRRQEEEDERRKRLGAESFARANQPVDTRMLYGAGGGLVALARGGMTYMEAGGTTGPMGEPRMVAGTGDGMSDSVPATIEGVQEARLANDEFVIPADVVADIGNGSSSAGAKKLYDMMDRIREARHGTTEQPPEVNAEQYMPA